MTETIGHARNMAAAVEIPVVCDVDDGFGDEINVMRTTREAIRAGLAGMYIEDQQAPKRCPALGGNKVITTEAMIRKLKAAFKVREAEDPDFVVIARTHASRVIGMEEAIKRGIAYAKEGAEVIFVDLCYSDKAIEELKIIAEKIEPHAHLLANMTETVGRPLLTNEDLQNLGFKIAFYPITAIITAAGALERVFKELKEKGTTKALVDGMMPFSKLGQLLGIDAIREQEQRFAEGGGAKGNECGCRC
jgi:methylisocitrate lyase